MAKKNKKRSAKSAFLKSVGAEIRRRRRAEGMTIADLARAAEFNAGFIGQIERGQRNFSLEVLWRLAIEVRLESIELR